MIYRRLILFLAGSTIVAVHSDDQVQHNLYSLPSTMVQNNSPDHSNVPIRAIIEPEPTGSSQTANFRFLNEDTTEVDYEDIYETLIFLAAVFAMGKMATMIGMPSLVGEIFCGFLLGPPLANFVPFPRAIVLIGELGLIMLLLEAGIDIDVAQLKETGGRSLAIAVTGSILPLVTGIGLSMASGTDVRTGIAVGACFSPTSLGVASNALQAGGISNTPIGQLIVASCVLDDIIALIILSIIQVLVAEDAELWEYFIPIISAFGSQNS